MRCLVDGSATRKEAGDGLYVAIMRRDMQRRYVAHGRAVDGGATGQKPPNFLRITIRRRGMQGTVNGRWSDAM